jgi:hypothetical protein
VHNKYALKHAEIQTGAEHMTDITPEDIKQFFENAAKANTDAWTAQTTYFEDLIKRNTDCFTHLGEVRVESFKEMSEATTFNQAFESNLAFEEKVREELAALQEKNTKSWEALVGQLTAIYTPPESKATPKAAKTKAPAKKAA